MRCVVLRCVLALLLLLGVSFASDRLVEYKAVIIIDDLGNHPVLDRAVTHLPGPVVCAILPDRSWSRRIARLAHSQEKDVIVHVPMEAVNHNALGAGALTLDMTDEEVKHTLQKDLDDIPFAIGINNHMGSLLTQDYYDMEAVMDVLKQDHLLFVDSRTIPDSVAYQTARLKHVNTLSRDVFLDDVQTTQAVDHQFRLLIALAKRHGFAVAIGHPYPVTVHYLQQHLADLHRAGVVLIPLSDALNAS